MTTLTVTIYNEDSEKRLTNMLHALGYDYSINSTDSRTPQPRTSAYSFLGRISKEDIDLMEKAIAEGCEQINPDDWK